MSLGSLSRRRFRGDTHSEPPNPQTGDRIVYGGHLGESVALLSGIRSGLFANGSVFLNAPAPGTSPNYVICNSIPKSGTYLLVELVKRLGAHTDIGFHTYTNSISKVLEDGSMEAERRMPALLWAAQMSPGYLCASHTRYCPVLESFLLSKPEHRMIFIVRDPRDIVISWVDFVYRSRSYAQMRAWNAFDRKRALRDHPNDSEQIASTIKSLPATGILDLLPWLNSPACLTVRFENLYRELSISDVDQPFTPTINKICNYLGVAKPSHIELRKALGKGLTESGRQDKVGVYKSRMTRDHFKMICSAEFQKLVIDLGYEPTDETGLRSARRIGIRLVRRFT